MEARTASNGLLLFAALIAFVPFLDKWRGGRNNKRKSLLPGGTRYALTPGCTLSPFQGDFPTFIEGLSISCILARVTEPISLSLRQSAVDTCKVGGNI